MGRVTTLPGRKGLYLEWWDAAQRRTRRKRWRGTKAEGRRAARELETQADRQAIGLGAPLTNHVEISTLITAWHAHLSGHTRPRTWETYASGLRTVLNWLEPRRHPRLVSDLRLDDVNGFKVEALAAGAADRTIAMRVGAVVQMLRWAEAEERIAANPLRGWKRPRGGKATQRTPLTQWEIAKLLTVSPPEMADVWRVFLGTGLRAGELTQLEWRDLDFEQRRLRVRGETSKSRRGRSLPLSATVAAVLQRLRLGVAGRPSRETARRLVFVNGGGGPWGDNLRKRLKPIVRAAGLRDDIDLHTLRHTFASHLAATGVDFRTLQELLGHSTASATEVYLHGFQPRLLEAVGAMEPMLTEAITATARRTRAASG